MDIFTAAIWLTISYIIYRICERIYRIPRIGRITQRRVLITGCDSGFGYLIAKRLDNYGVYVFAACLTEAGETKLRKECSSRIKTLMMDVTKPDTISRAYNEVKKQIPEGEGLWGLINNAGIAKHLAPVEFLKLEHYREVMDINLLGLIDTTVKFLPLLKQAKGRIVNTASMLGRCSIVIGTTYCVSKYGVECFSDAIRRQLRDYGVTVHLIEPGYFNTNMGNIQNQAEKMRETWTNGPKEIQEEYGDEYLENMIHQTLEKGVGNMISNRLDLVVDAYEHALLGRFPKARYLIGNDARFFFIPVNSLPEWLSDYIFEVTVPNRPISKAVK